MQPSLPSGPGQNHHLSLPPCCQAWLEGPRVVCRLAFGVGFFNLLVTLIILAWSPRRRRGRPAAGAAADAAAAAQAQAGGGDNDDEVELADEDFHVKTEKRKAGGRKLSTTSVPVHIFS